MPQYENLKIQHTGQSMNALIRELNRSLDKVRNTGNLNFTGSYPTQPVHQNQNGDITALIAPGEYEIDRWTVYVDNVTPNPTINLRLDGVNQDTQTPNAISVFEYELDPVISVPRLSRVSINVASLAVGAVVTASIGLRRLT